MGTINKKRKDTIESHLNWMGGRSFDINDPILRLQIAASSSFFGEPQYYQQDAAVPARTPAATTRARLSDAQVSGLRSTLDALDPQEWRSMTPTALMVSAIDAALAHDPETTLALAVELRNETNVRVTPQVIMVRAANHPKVKSTGLIGKYAGGILGRLDEVCTQMAYQLAEYGKPIPSSLKRAWAKRIEAASTYELAKYRLEGHDVNLYDVINVCHPAGDDVSRLMRGELKLATTADAGIASWESIRSAGGSWAEAASVMGHMALLRNMRNLVENDALTEALLDRMVTTAETGKQLPFRYYAAYRELEKLKEHIVFSGSLIGHALDSIEECMKRSLGALPHFGGRVMSLVDNSGSAWGATTSSMGTLAIAEIGNLMGVLTAKVSDEGYVGVFGDGLDVRAVRKGSSIFDDLATVSRVGRTIGQGTENGIWMFWDRAIRERVKWDTVFIYSDQQAGHGGLYGIDQSQYADYRWSASGGPHIDVSKLIRAYRERVNPKVNVFCVQTAGYQDTIVPEFYKRTAILGGWSERVLHFASWAAQVWDKQ